MIIPIAESATLGRLQRMLPLTLLVIGALSALQMDLRSPAMFFAAAMIHVALHRLDPRGFSLYAQGDGCWRICRAGGEARECELKSRGQLSGVVWLEFAHVVKGANRSEQGSLLIFADALDREAYRALRRALKMPLRAAP